MQKWEYRVKHTNDFIDHFDDGYGYNGLKLGMEGWELVGFSRNTLKDKEWIFIFKRPIESDSDDDL